MSNVLEKVRFLNKVFKLKLIIFPIQFKLFMDVLGIKAWIRFLQTYEILEFQVYYAELLRFIGMFF